MAFKPKKGLFSLRAKFGILFGVFFLLTAGVLGTSFYHIFHLRGEAQHINDAGSERMRSYKLAFLLNEYVTGGQAVRDSLKAQIYKEVETFEEIMFSLRDDHEGRRLLSVEGAAVPSGKTDSDIHASLTLHIKFFQSELKPGILQVLEPISPEESLKLLNEVKSIVPMFVNEIDKTVKMMEEHVEGELAQFMTIEFILMCLVVAFTIFSVFFVGLAILRPINKVHRGVRAFAKGKLDEKITVRGMDEIGELANGFNDMAEELAREYRLINERNGQLKELNKLLKETSLRDCLTGCYNKYYFQEVLRTEHHEAKRYGRPLSLLMLDLDHFKTVNDLWGHPFGDFVLKEFAILIKGQLRTPDIVCRVGGEEFIVLLPSTTEEGALEVAEKLRKTVMGHSFSNGDKCCQLTVTIGVSSRSELNVYTWADLLRHADEAVREGKIQGRNCTVSWEEVYNSALTARGIEAQDLVALREKFMVAGHNYKRAYMETAMVLCKTLETRDNYSMKHSYQVADYSVKLTKSLDQPNEKVEVIRNAAILHDIGKIGIQDDILMKEGPLKEEEKEIIKKHPCISLSILGNISLLNEEMPIIYHHHERWDGGGYPVGLKGKDIPLGARILAIADAYESITNDRPYREKRSSEEAFKELKKYAGSQFDPELVPMFISVMQKVLEQENLVEEVPQALSLEPSIALVSKD